MNGFCTFILSLCFLLFILFFLKSIDASREDGSLGRLINDDHRQPNCKMKKINVNGKPHLCLFAVNDIKEGEEITYDYGGSDCPWRTQVRSLAKSEVLRSMKKIHQELSSTQYKRFVILCKIVI